MASGLGVMGQPTAAKASESVSDAASLMPSLEGKNVIVGYWHNWLGKSDGYQNGTSNSDRLSETPYGYNVVDVAFMVASEDNRIPTFKPYNGTDSEFRAEVAKLNAEGRAVILSMGGAEAHIDFEEGDTQAFADEIIRLVETYGFDGLDIDLEHKAITAGANQKVIPEALKIVKEYYKEQGKNFLITMAPEFPHLRTNGKYVSYVKDLEGYYDFIHPQLYNQWGDGVTGLDGKYLAQNNDAVKEDFLYTISHYMIKGNGFVQIPAHKLALGLPANPDGAGNGYVKNPEDLRRALERLKADGTPIKGLMTWSVNWDGGWDKNGNPYNHGFVNTYTPIIHNGGVVDKEAPTVPGTLASKVQTKSTITLQWNASADNVKVKEYEIYRDGKKIGTSNKTSFTDKGLVSGKAYSYVVKAVDTSGNVSDASSAVRVKTK